jgi:IS4 transposase
MLFCSVAIFNYLREVSGAMPKITFYHCVNKREFEVLTNLFNLRADLIARLYRILWQIELLFKQLKQNFFPTLFLRR